MSSSPVVDPIVLKFCQRVTEGGAAVPDGIAGLLIRLAGRVAVLERTVAKLDPGRAFPRSTDTGIEGRNGDAVGPERDSAPARPAPHSIGRPKGRVDSPPPRSRQRTIGWSHREDLEFETSRLVDADWDR
jgi:hypothetical protein